jgi:hypothetical protein
MTNVLLVLVYQGFFPFNLCKKLHFFLWHHTLNQHIHIATMYPFGIRQFNTMILIPLCENCKLCTYWYHMVWVFAFSPPIPILPWYTNFKKRDQIPIPDGYVKNPIPVLHWKKPPSVQLVITRLMKIEQEKGQRMLTRRPPKTLNCHRSRSQPAVGQWSLHAPTFLSSATA